MTAGVSDHVQFLGLVSQQDVPMLLAAADVAVAPSVHDAAGNVDGLPNTVLEILASGTPLVTTRAGGIGSVVSDGHTGRLVPERDVHALAGAIDGLLQQPSLRATMGLEARETVRSQYSWSRTTDAFEAIYERIAASR
jgi:glycosyltransferase involved in cell wall biosynthesis